MMPCHDNVLGYEVMAVKKYSRGSVLAHST